MWFVDDCCGGVFDLTISPSWSGQIEFEVSKYGGINLRTIESSLSEAIKQLNRSGEDYPNIPRLVVLAFVSDVVITSNSKVVVIDGRVIQEEELWKLIDRVMKRHPEVSAVAIMAHTHQPNPYFAVFHNSNVSIIQALDGEAFEDGNSVQFDSLETIPRSRLQPFNLQELEASIIKTAKTDEKYSITVADYEALRAKKQARD